jgi:ribonuclease D
MAIKLYKGDLPAGLDFGSSVAIDTETLGLNPRRDKLCLVQLSSGDGNAHLVQLDRSAYDAPHLKVLLTNPNVTKIFHYARFDVAALKHHLGVATAPV